MNVRAYEVLEFGRIRELLAGFAESEPGRVRALSLEAETDPERIDLHLEETTEARRLHDEAETVSLAGLPEIDLLLDELAITGRVLDVPDFVALARFATTATRLRSHLLEREDDLPRLSTHARALPPLEEMGAGIARIIDVESVDVRDDASTDLAKLRARASRLRKRLQKALDQTLSSRDNAKILQEPIVTTRNGRSVVPVKAECKAQFPGIVHGSSASGATLFVEPMAIVEVGNEIASVHDQEGEEIRRILTSLTERIRPARASLEEASNIVTTIDVIQAKGRLSASYRGEAPRLGDELRLVDARHPLLENPVPVSFHLSGGRKGLVFTGRTPEARRSP